MSEEEEKEEWREAGAGGERRDAGFPHLTRKQKDTNGICLPWILVFHRVFAKALWAILRSLVTQSGFVDELLILSFMMDTLWFDLLVHQLRQIRTLFSVLWHQVGMKH